MRSTMRAMLLASLMLAVPGCVSRPVVVASPASCATLIPSNWREGVPGADIPAAAPPKAPTIEGELAQAIGQLKLWVGFGVDESSRREQANGRTRDAIGIFERCEARDATALKRARPRFLGIF